jgi:FkbM family methyltransferase
VSSSSADARARVPGWRSYLGLRPASARDAVTLASCYATAVLSRIVHRKGYLTPGQLLRRPLLVWSGGVRFRLRPGSDDLNMVLPGHKPAVDRWFRPAPGEFVVDVGAHVGYYSLWAAKAGSRVLALEPNPALTEALQANFALNPPLRVEVDPRAAGPSAGDTTLWVPPVLASLASLDPAWPPAHSASRGAAMAVPIRVAPLDAVVPSGADVDWLLIDTEGGESGVLEGAREVLLRTRCAIIEVADGPGREVCARRLKESGLAVLDRQRQGANTEYWLAGRPSSAAG